LITVGTGLLVIPGLILIALTTIPGLLGESFNLDALICGLTLLKAGDAAFILAVMSIFGAKQFHPILQCIAIERYFVYFFMFMTAGTLVGGILIPLICPTNMTMAYFIPAATICLGLFIFILGYPSYVKTKTSITYRWYSNGGNYTDSFVQKRKQLGCVIPVTALVIPFNILQDGCLASTLKVQGTAMKQFGVIDATMMEILEALSVLVCGVLIVNGLYPALQRRGIHLATTHKYALGTFSIVLAYVCQLIIEYQIHSKYTNEDKQISVLWQSFSYIFIGAGEIFALSSAFDAAFKVAPKEHKVIASAAIPLPSWALYPTYFLWLSVTMQSTGLLMQQEVVKLIQSKPTQQPLFKTTGGL